MDIRYSPLERKIALIRLGVSQRTIAKKCRTSCNLVSGVIKGYRAVRYDGHAARVRAEVARLIGQPVERVFPEYAEHIAKKAVA